jgi:PTH1 family peptidyl-tRNA hydrolase
MNDKHSNKIKVVAKLNLRNGEKDNSLGFLDELIEKTRKEDGCISYELFENVRDENALTFIAEWESDSKLNDHLNSEHFTRIMPQLGELTSTENQVDIYKRVK